MNDTPGTDLSVIEGQYIAPQQSSDIGVSRAPQKVLDEAKLAAMALQDVISKKLKPVMMNGEQYLEFEDWQTLGRFYGVTARVRCTAPLTMGTAQGFEATAEAVRADGMVISAADAMCMNDEEKWGMRPKYKWEKGDRIQVGEVATPLYQLRSMAQTRACAKALRNVLAWVVVLAGYKPTPAEEMSGVEAGNDENEPSCPECGKVGAIIKGKEEYGGGFLCFKKKGGCGFKFKEFPLDKAKETPEEFDQRTIDQRDTTVDCLAPYQQKAIVDAMVASGKSQADLETYLNLAKVQDLAHVKKGEEFQMILRWANGVKAAARPTLDVKKDGKPGFNWAALYASASDKGYTREQVKDHYTRKYGVSSGTELNAKQFAELSVTVSQWADISGQ